MSKTNAILMSFLLAVVAGRLHAQPLEVEDGPRRFSLEIPDSWVRYPTVNPLARVKYATPEGTPPAECAIIVQEYPELAGESQARLSQKMAVPLTVGEAAAELATRFDNVEVFSSGVATISGLPAQMVNYRYSTVTAQGVLWARGMKATLQTTPGLVWVVSCAALGKTPEEAQESYSYRQAEIAKFPATLKIK